MSALPYFRKLSTLTEAELDDYRFVIEGDPREMYPLLDAIPDGAELLSIVHHYRYKPEKLSCVDCGSARHHRGAVVLLSTGQFCLLGSVCGRKRFPDAWDEAETEFNRAKEQQETRLRHADIQQRLPDILKACRALRYPCAQLSQFEQQFREAMGRSTAAIFVDELARNEGLLTEHIKLRAETAEAFHEATGRASGKSSKDQFQIRNIGRISGYGFMIGKSCRDQLETIHEALMAIERSLNSKSLKLPKMKRIQGEFDRQLSDVRLLIASYDEALKLLTSSNARVIDRWLQSAGHKKNCEYQHGKMIFTDLTTKGTESVSCDDVDETHNLKALLGSEASALWPVGL